MVYRDQADDSKIIVAEPNRSASWQANKMVLMAMCAVSGTIAVGFAALGAWPILPFAGLEMAALGSALYYVCWKLRYRHVITLDHDLVRIQKGHYHPRQQWQFPRAKTALSVVPENHPWDGPDITVYSQGESVLLGDFLNRDERLQLLALLREDLRVGDFSVRTEQNF